MALKLDRHEACLHLKGTALSVRAISIKSTYPVARGPRVSCKRVRNKIFGKNEVKLGDSGISSDVPAEVESQ